MKHFMFTHTFHSHETKKIFFKAHFGKKSRDCLMLQMMMIMLDCLNINRRTRLLVMSLHSRSEDLIHKKLEDLKGDKLFYTLAQETKSIVTFTEPDRDFITY